MTDDRRRRIDDRLATRPDNWMLGRLTLSLSLSLSLRLSHLLSLLHLLRAAHLVSLAARANYFPARALIIARVRYCAFV